MTALGRSSLCTIRIRFFASGARAFDPIPPVSRAPPSFGPLACPNLGTEEASAAFAAVAAFAASAVSATQPHAEEHLNTRGAATAACRLDIAMFEENQGKKKGKQTNPRIFCSSLGFLFLSQQEGQLVVRVCQKNAVLTLTHALIFFCIRVLKKKGRLRAFEISACCCSDKQLPLWTLTYCLGI